VSGGRIDGRRCASMDFPAPGAPLIRRLWPITPKTVGEVDIGLLSV
jgi:hypothetical protein